MINIKLRWLASMLLMVSTVSVAKTTLNNGANEILPFSVVAKRALTNNAVKLYDESSYNGIDQLSTNDVYALTSATSGNTQTIKLYNSSTNNITTLLNIPNPYTNLSLALVNYASSSHSPSAIITTNDADAAHYYVYQNGKLSSPQNLPVINNIHAIESMVFCASAKPYCAIIAQYGHVVYLLDYDADNHQFENTPQTIAEDSILYNSDVHFDSVSLSLNVVAPFQNQTYSYMTYAWNSTSGQSSPNFPKIPLTNATQSVQITTINPQTQVVSFSNNAGFTSTVAYSTDSEKTWASVSFTPPDQGENDQSTLISNNDYLLEQQFDESGALTQAQYVSMQSNQPTVVHTINFEAHFASPVAELVLQGNLLWALSLEQRDWQAYDLATQSWSNKKLPALPDSETDYNLTTLPNGDLLAFSHDGQYLLNGQQWYTLGDHNAFTRSALSVYAKPGYATAWLMGD